MVDRVPADGSSSGSMPGVGPGPGIRWAAGDEDYPFVAHAGETALDYFERWLEDAPYARIEQNGARYIHETDLTNVLNHITADVGLLQARLDEFGDHVLTAADNAATIQRIDDAVVRLTEARATLSRDGSQ